MSIEDKKQMVKDLLWIVPINFLVIVLGFTYTAHRIQQLEENQINMQSGDSARALKIDSLAYRIEEANSLKKLINK